VRLPIVKAATVGEAAPIVVADVPLTLSAPAVGGMLSLTKVSDEPLLGLPAMSFELTV